MKSGASIGPAALGRANFIPEWDVSAGLTQYDSAIAAMRERVSAIQAGAAPEKIWLVEHPPLYTAGTSARPEELTDPHRFPTFAAGRGGQWTYHGPGQLVGYPIINLKPDRQDVHRYVRDLEEVLIRTIAEYGINGKRISGLTGVWVGNEKIAELQPLVAQERQAQEDSCMEVRVARLRAEHERRVAALRMLANSLDPESRDAIELDRLIEEATTRLKTELQKICQA